ncbi:proline dehydrogenase [Parabacteroides sp. PF5-5]|uniref:proline dehydrogenase family protein n=1 Tax=unclassified Parabacteroides TaxID=2649774 RepID=UPI002474FFA6|nr:MULTISPECIES: proline dehydrogenase family protein [unclassified Parabacteroides]MDH6304256.1 proline dehydrogenase [Parabacteroides sp. PH5-39]MDH6315029.1 proline dehydrogenase [Parabacteroides sp. PF5-13]MDH6318689.1 proline dehydrogenase [Parabacteroides sp. PH5-13]MDH6322419.1 proline dehydrogenase [Parabacteroides sp. PH5-8]MDH6326446.1 proline dehydrogenase [Parabacteroides sp. PH5-41]
MIDFNNTEIAFSSKSKSELRNAYVLFNVMKYPSIVKLGKFASNIALNIHFPLGWIVKPTLYKQFVGGETLEDTTKYINFLKEYNVKSTLDYSAESKKTPAGIQATFEETLRSVDFAKGNPNIAYAVFKPSTLTTDEVLCKASEKREELTIEEVKAFREFKERFMALCQRAYDNNVRILVDAEDYCFQDAIDELTDDAMRQFNKEQAIVFATLQMYRHDRMPYLRRIYDDSIEKGYYPGIKFVRGAYMEEERKRAEIMGYPDPICKDKAATDENFDAGVKFVVDHIDRMQLFMGTHNENSNYKLAALIDEKGLQRNDQRIYFSQLLGMSDNISFNLAHENYNVTKYVPYAKVRDVLPYLLRRAEENTSVAGQTSRELKMLQAEMRRRKK